MDNTGIGIGNLGILLIRFELAAIFWMRGWEYEFALLVQGLALLFLGSGTIAL